MREVEARLDGWTAEQIATDPDYLAALERLTRAARESANDEKRSYLLNAAANAGNWGTEPEQVRTRFVELVSQYSPIHVVLLRFFADPPRWFDEQGRSRPAYLTGALASVLGDHVFAGDPLFPDEVGRCMAELGADGLLDSPGLNSTMTGAGLLQPRIKPLGRRFLAFIEEPPRQTP